MITRHNFRTALSFVVACARTRLTLVALLSAIIFSFTAAPAQAIVLFWENFEGYYVFPAQIPWGDPVNPGLPTQAKGAKEYWYGGRFQSGSNGTIDSDLAVQKFGGGSNMSHTGRMEDNAGILLNISTLGYENVTLTYEWRTFAAKSGNQFKAGYFVGDLDFGNSRFYDFVADFGNSWWSNEWTQTTSGRSDKWSTVSVTLPSDVESIWVAFWLQGGKDNYGKVDNIKIKATKIIPEPSSMLIAVVGAALCGGVAVRRRLGARAAR